MCIRDSHQHVQAQHRLHRGRIREGDPLGCRRRQPEHNRHPTIIADSGAPREPRPRAFLAPSPPPLPHAWPAPRVAARLGQKGRAEHSLWPLEIMIPTGWTPITERRLFARPPREWPTTLCDRYRAGVRGRINRGSARGGPGDCQPARRTCTPALAALAAAHLIAGYERAILASSPHTCRACSTPRGRQLRGRQIPDDWPASSPPCSARPDLACIAVP